MIGAEVIFLLVVLGGGGFLGASLLDRWHRSSTTRDKLRDDLHAALDSRDYRRLDDFLTMWGADITPKHAALIQSRRDELYLEHDAHGP